VPIPRLLLTRDLESESVARSKPVRALLRRATLNGQSSPNTPANVRTVRADYYNVSRCPLRGSPLNDSALVVGQASPMSCRRLLSGKPRGGQSDDHRHDRDCERNACYLIRRVCRRHGESIAWATGMWTAPLFRQTAAPGSETLPLGLSGASLRRLDQIPAWCRRAAGPR
jgi:hypothetical protein